jgi:hypothetical protein
MTSTTFLYSLKVWLSSVAAAPLMFAFVIVLEKSSGIASYRDNLASQLSLYPIMLFFELLFSFITWLLFMLITATIVYFCSIKLQKLLIPIACILLTIGTFRIALFNGGFGGDSEFLWLMVCNCICIGAGSWFYKFKHTDDEKIIQ